MISTHRTPRSVFALGLFLVCSLARPIHAGSVPARVLSGLEATSARVRISAIIAVAKSQDPSARAIVQGMLKDPSPAVRAAAVDALARIHDLAAIPALQAARADASPLVRRLAAETLRAWEQEAAPARAGALMPGDATTSPAGAGTTSSGTTSSGTTSSRDTLSTRQPGTTFSGAETALWVGAAVDYSGQASADALDKLTKLVRYTLRTEASTPVRIEAEATANGYGLMLGIRRIKPFSQDGIQGLEVRCELTVVQLPAKALRLSLAANAAVGVEGTLDDTMRASLMSDAVDACGPSLAKDFLQWAAARSP